MKVAVSIFMFIIFAGVAILFLVNVQELKEMAAAKPVGACGVVYPDSYNPNDEKAQIGHGLFMANCAACHRLDALSTGPALRGITVRYKEEHTISLDSFFYLKRYHREKNTRNSCFITPEITDEDIKNILFYTQ